MFTVAKLYLDDICSKNGEDTFLTPRRKSALLSKDPKYFKVPTPLITSELDQITKNFAKHEQTSILGQSSHIS